ncbi:MAG: glycine--tRNA ligase subunit beta [Alphaproteobacteria bacterium]|nr:glycine--tRNA ligase subunit beta [Alphaproteobacteria bacterium]
MPDLLLELLTEEIPARMQAVAARELQRLAEIVLQEATLAATRIETFVTPRRLTLAVAGLPKMQPGSAEERRGPRVGAPEPAIYGFLKSVGLSSLDQCEKRVTDRGEFYFAVIKRPGQATKDVLSKILHEVIRTFPWPKSMRWPGGVAPLQFVNEAKQPLQFVNVQGQPIQFVNQIRWVRPIQSIICLFDGRVVPLTVGSLKAGNKTEGHRFLSRGAFAVRDLEDYRAKLKRAKVVLDAAERRALIESGLAKAATNAGLKVQHDEVLLEEVTGLVEWPVVLMGSIDPSFMDLPPEVLTTAMRAHQKYFATLDKSGRLAPRFLLVSNMAASDGGNAIVAGNERVLKARLADARFFWDQDRKTTLASRVDKLKERVFHAKLGTMYDKMIRVSTLAETVAPHVPGADLARLRRAVELAKADLSSGMVGEFPELQGVVGRYYALADGEPHDVADAIAEHYAPLGPTDRCPTVPLSVALALADKFDTLVSFFAIGEKPTGSGDPFALRRAALGVIRLILENKLRVPLRAVFEAAAPAGNNPGAELLAFFEDRLKVHLRERGVRHDLIAAVFALGDEDDLVRLLARVEALQAFVAGADGANLLVAYRRAANILRIEEKKDKRTYSGVPRPDLLQAAEERTLDKALHHAAMSSAAALEAEDFAAAMLALAALRGPVDQFFDKVTVNTDDKELRENRLRLLSQIRDTLNRVADFSQIEG